MSGSAKDASSTPADIAAPATGEERARSGRAGARPPGRTAGRRPKRATNQKASVGADRVVRVGRGRAIRTGRRRPTRPRRRRRARDRRRRPAARAGPRRPRRRAPARAGPPGRRSRCRLRPPLGVGVRSRRATPTRPGRRAATSTGRTTPARRRRPGAPGGVDSREQYRRGGVPPSGDRSPASTGRRRGPARDRSPCRAGRRDGESSGMSQTAATTSPNRSHDRDDLSTLPLPPAPTSPTAAPGTATSPDPSLPPPRPGAHRRRPGVVGLDPRRRPGPARHGRSGRLRRRLGPLPGRSALPAPHAVAHPGPRRGSDRPRRAPLRGVRGRHGDGLDVRRCHRHLRPQPAGLARARPLLAALDARHVPHRHPHRGRRPVEGPVPLLADGRRELGRRHHPRDGHLRREAGKYVGALHLLVGYAVLGVLVSRKRD